MTAKTSAAPPTNGAVAARLQDPDRLTDPELIGAAIEQAGTSARVFAEFLMGRDERTIRRWNSGDIDIPPKARAWLSRWLTLSDATRGRIVGALLAR